MTHGSFIPKLMAVAFAACAGLQAESITVSDFFVSSVADGYRWQYDMAVSAGAKVQTGDYFVLLDWAGYVPSTAAAPSGWSFFYGGTTPCPPGQAEGCAIDDPGVNNVMWTYTGAATLGPGVSLGSFYMTSLYEDVNFDGLLVAQDHSKLSGKLQGNNQSIPVPLGGSVSVPESATVFELGFYASLGGAIALIYRRRAALASR